MSYKLEPAIWSRDTGQQIAWSDRCQLIITWGHISKKYMVNQSSMSLSTYYLEQERGHHVARLHRHWHRHAYAPTRNTAGHNNMRKQFMGFLYFPIWVWGSTLGRQSSAMMHSGLYFFDVLKMCLNTVFSVWYILIKTKIKEKMEKKWQKSLLIMIRYPNGVMSWFPLFKLDEYDKWEVRGSKFQNLVHNIVKLWLRIKQGLFFDVLVNWVTVMLVLLTQDVR